MSQGRRRYGMFSNMVNFWFVSIFYMARVKAYIYRYDFFVPILRLSTVAPMGA